MLKCSPSKHEVPSSKPKRKKKFSCLAQWYMTIILATQDAEIHRITV